MAVYSLEVTTGDMAYSGTTDCVFVTLTGTEGESERTKLDNFGIDFSAGKTGSYTVKTSSPLGKLLLVKVEKDPFLFLPENEWFCSQIVVTTPEEELILFPCHRWVSRGENVELRGGKAMKVFEDDHPLLIDHRKRELILHNHLYQWRTFAEGVSRVSNFNDMSELPAEIRFSMSRALEISYTKKTALAELKLKGLSESADAWEDIEAMKNVFWLRRTPISEYVAEHWTEDDFYGFQFLNATNSNVIQRCKKLPSNFPVTEEMVKPFLEDGSTLQMEMEKGNVFICNYKMMDGLPTRMENGELLPLTAGLCLLYSNPENKLMPIAIQLHQQPSVQNPIFLPSDPETDWLLAKMFLKNAEAIQYQIIYHLLNTHFLTEACAVATFRCFPVIHPLYKLLLPHFRYTIPINTVGRARLLGSGGVFSESSLGPDGLIALMKRALSETTYSSLCLPENIAARGLESVPNFYYRDDGLRLWSIVNSFVEAVVKNYYPSDWEVCKDSELQTWINEIFTNAFFENASSGIPAHFHTAEEVIKFITMVIFTASAGHGAVNNGQFDYHSWIPNSSLLLRKAPPYAKGQATMQTVLETLPSVGQTVNFMSTAWLLGKKYGDRILLGSYPAERFDELAVKQMIKEFQAELLYLSEAIAKRNAELVVPYNYLNPAEIENSVSI
ncbi:hydroperoxide isomerase ALOXE3-like [Lampris incognitus]|uniref:hydroperoxide isomerase ALOXE3-like n=1 Tax=Lampris incognitus TaxID=2546036 RepID=UPI0024B57EE9|nr:hydroperoxide isomerase ALOXE3-like [Lampris incognitus]